MVISCGQESVLECLNVSYHCTWGKCSVGQIMNTIIYSSTTHLLENRLHVSAVIRVSNVLGLQYTQGTYDLSAAGLRMT